MTIIFQINLKQDKFMKKIIALIVSILIFGNIFATDQVPDVLYYNNMELKLSTGWGHPSPLETYFYQNNIPYPFKMLSTANYRGHIAFWTIQNNQLFIKKIVVRDSTFSPQKFKIKSKTDTTLTDDFVFADWFSGIIDCQLRDSKNYWKVIKSYYFHIRNGHVIDIQEITEKDFKKIQNISEKDTSDKELMNKYKILYLNQNYISYYFRLNENDRIVFNSEECLLNSSVEKLSPIFAYFNNDHLNWPYNWENVQNCGAPNCKWLIESDKLYLTELKLYSGLNFDSIVKEPVDLNILFKDLENNKVFAKWVNGVYLIKQGSEKEDELLKGYKTFVPSNFTYIRIKDGIIEQKCTIPADFDFKKFEVEGNDEGLKKIIKDY
jgi:hypothetical protein